MTLIVAHRGASTRAPENTLEAFALAVEAGADAIELDVHLTSDGQLAVIHDDTLERTTDRTGAVSTLSMDQVRKADAGAGFAGPDQDHPSRGRGVRVPTLPEVLDWLPAQVGLVVEIKAANAADAVVAALAGHAVRDDGRVSVISFHERAIDRVRELDSQVRTGYLLVPGQALDAAMVWTVEHGHAAVCPWDGDLGPDPERVLALARAYGCLVASYVVNDPDRMQLHAARGLWAFVTDVPEVAVAVLRRQARTPAP